MSEKTSDGWIPGNEPEKEGAYEITWNKPIGKTNVDVGHYSNNTWFVDPSLDTGDKLEESNIMAFKSITLSDPYIPPESERELLCLFCDSKECGIDEDDKYFYCNNCLAEIPKKTEKEMLEIYDKLNPVKK